LPLSGVGFPAHFLVAYEAEPRLLVDPFDCGRMLTVPDCEQLSVVQPSALEPQLAVRGQGALGCLGDQVSAIAFVGW
jgi:hypothetical protein